MMGKVEYWELQSPFLLETEIPIVWLMKQDVESEPENANVCL